MHQPEWSFLHYNASVDVELFHARCVKHAFPAHMHDYYVICLIEKGLQTFSHRGGKYVTPAGGANPLEAETLFVATLAGILTRTAGAPPIPPAGCERESPSGRPCAPVFFAYIYHVIY